MVHDITEGAAVVEAQMKNKAIFQVGSQGMSSLGNEKAKQLYESGAIGQLNYAEGFWARNSPVVHGNMKSLRMLQRKRLTGRNFKELFRPCFDPKRFFSLALLQGLWNRCIRRPVRTSFFQFAFHCKFYRTSESNGYRWPAVLERRKGSSGYTAGVCSTIR